MRVCTIFITGCTLAACALMTPPAARAQSLSQPDGWEVRAADGETTEWAPAPPESSAEGGA